MQYEHSISLSSTPIKPARPSVTTSSPAVIPAKSSELDISSIQPNSELETNHTSNYGISVTQRHEASKHNFRCDLAEKYFPKFPPLFRTHELRRLIVTSIFALPSTLSISLSLSPTSSLLTISLSHQMKINRRTAAQKF